MAGNMLLLHGSIDNKSNRDKVVLLFSAIFQQCSQYGISIALPKEVEIKEWEIMRIASGSRK